MRHYIELYNPKTGKRETRDYPNSDEAFKAYWELTDNPSTDIEFELVTSNEGD